MKKFVSAIITILISVLLVFLVFSISLKDVIINTLSKEVVANEISSKLTTYLRETGISNEDLEKVEINIMNSGYTDEITEKYFDNIVEVVVNNQDVKIPSTKDQILEILNEMDLDIDQSTKEEISNRISGQTEMGRVYKNITNEVKNSVSDSEKNFIKLYSKIITTEFKMIVISMIIILIILLGIIKNSFYKWIINLSIATLLSGLFLSFILPKIIDFVINDIMQMIGNYSVNLNPLINAGYICLALFGIFMIVYFLFSKIAENKLKSYDY